MRQLILGTAGHIDHGKTALVAALTGVDTDRLPEEKQRGITIDIGFAHLEVGDVQFGIVDVPGHERFIRNMLAGAAGVDLAMLVIAADDSIMPQTREHLAILQLLQIPAGLIVLTKCDLVEPDWLDLVEDEARSLVRDTFLDGAPIVRTSAATGAGIDELKQTLARLASENEHTILEAVASGHFRLPVDRSFVLGGLGTVVTGTVWSGAISAGDEVEWLPLGRRVRLRGLQSHGRSVERVQAGQRAAMNLIGVHHSEIMRGHELASPGLLRSSRRITAHLRVLAESPLPVRHRARLRVHLGTQEVLAGVRLLEGTSLEPGESGIVQLISSQPFIARGRQPLIIRAESPLVTLGGGIVLQCAPDRLSRRDAAAADRASALLSPDELSRADGAIRFFGARPWSAEDLACELDVEVQLAERLVEQLVAQKRVIELATGARRAALMHVDLCNEIEARLLESLRRLHAENPIEPTVPRQRLAQGVRYLDGDLLAGLLARLVRSGKIVGGETGVALRDHAGRLTAAQEAARERMVQRFEKTAFQPPDPAELAGEFGLSGEQMRQLLALCVHRRHLVHLGGGLYLHQKWDEQLRHRIGESLGGGAGLTVAEIRDLLDTTRKYALPICEYLDRLGLTRRRGDLRTAGPAANAGATIESSQVAAPPAD
ncbi:MAG: selenocysteine-specific translation elongation factor [Phycisphaerales bacterium]|nr:selenocysteine-specific translation elongation factor [Phycisphaerales bacterium]